MSESITKLVLGEREFILLGTAHISRESVEEVKELITGELPDRVCIEIDESRYKSLVEKSQWSNLNISAVLKGGKGFLLLANLILSSFQRKLGMDLGIKPGEEMVTAINLSKELDIPFSLCDRDIQITLKRAWAMSGFWGKNKMLAAMLSAVFSNEKLKQEDIEALKEKNALQNMLNELAEYLPAVKEVLIDERDQYLATKIFSSAGNKVVAIIGAGHVNGIIGNIEALDAGDLKDELSSLEEIPPAGKLSKFLPYLAPLLILGLFATGFLRSGLIFSISMIWKWIVVNGTLSSIGALIAFAHPLTVLLAFVAAPITSINPTVGVGLFTGVLESILRKPRVSDFEHLPEDILSIKGFFRNRITHILLVFFFSSIGSVVGTFIGIPYLTSLLR
ncbi:hypothetical protein ES705_19029 [subsurface metagenome]